jgi:DNA-binding transcriptional ArsR family regulator
MPLLSGGFSNTSMDAFYALAEPHRRQVVEILAHRGQLSATQICDEFDVTPQAISQHLRVLREANVIQMERKAQQRIYAFNPNSMFEIKKWVADMAEMWNSRLDRLDKALKDDEGSTARGKAR